MTAERIAKSTIHLASPHHLQDYDAERRAFSWDVARSALDGLPGGGLNIAHEAIDRHVARGAGAKTALRWLDETGQPLPRLQLCLAARA